ncbi:MAG: Hsp33 family molecular chaperone HslO [Thermoanaerobaculia bacterium]|nr:Hsp33 family molecular chaperone HslO [Thermoanaerobaculia bacterium]
MRAPTPDRPAARGGTPVAGASAAGELRLGVAGQLDLRWAVVDLGAAVEEARRRHDLSPIAATALGRALAGAALLRALATRSCRRLSLTVAGDGPLGNLVAEADAAGSVRGFVGAPRVELPARADGRLPIGEAVGRGTLRVRRELADGSHGDSQVALVNGEIGLDLAHYLEQSEQVQSAVSVGVLAGPEGVRAAGGFLVEVIPAASSELVRQVEQRLGELGSVSRRLADGGIDSVVAALFGDTPHEARESLAVRFRCSCSRAELLPRLAALPVEDRAEIVERDGSITAQCAYCSTVYVYAASELGERSAP